MPTTSERIASTLLQRKKEWDYWWNRVLVKGQGFDESKIVRFLGWPIKVGDQAIVFAGRSSGDSLSQAAEEGRRVVEAADYLKEWMEVNATPELMHYYYPGMDLQSIANIVTSLVLLDQTGNSSMIEQLVQKGAGPVRLPGARELWAIGEVCTDSRTGLSNIPLAKNANPTLFPEKNSDLVLPLGGASIKPLLIVADDPSLKQQTINAICEGIYWQQDPTMDNALASQVVFSNGGIAVSDHPAVVEAGGNYDLFRSMQLYNETESSRRLTEKGWYEGPLGRVVCVDNLGALVQNINRDQECGDLVRQSMLTTMDQISAGAWGMNYLLMSSWDTMANMSATDPLMEQIATRSRVVMGKPSPGSMGQQFVHEVYPELEEEFERTPQNMVLGWSGDGQYERFWMLR